MKRIFWIMFLYAVSINVLASDIKLDLSVIGNNQKPVLNVKTNLPPKTILMASLANPKNQGGDGYFGQATAAVQTNQVVKFGPFSKNGDPLSPGTYQVKVTTIMAALQPQEIQVFFGRNGERLEGQQVSTLPGTQEKGISQEFQFKINPDSSISGSSSDEHIIGSSNDIWQKFRSDGSEIYVKTNGFYYTKESYSGYGFRTYIVANLPESNIVGAPQSIMHDVEGNCETRTFHKLGSIFFAGKNRSGVAIQNMPPEEIEKKLVPNSPFEKAFDLLCKTAKNQK